MLTHECRASRFDDRAWFLGAGTVEVDLFCNLLLACATFSENYGIGVSGGNSPNRLFYASERFALPWNKVIGKRQHHLFRSGIPADSLDKLLVYCWTLDDVNGSPAFHYIGNLQRIQVIHYGNHGEFVTLAFAS